MVRTFNAQNPAPGEPSATPRRPRWRPAETFEFAVEWPFGGIELTIAELDGAAIVAAAGRSARYWPDTAGSPES
jgi:hypothetical protein